MLSVNHKVGLSVCLFRESRGTCKSLLPPISGLTLHFHFNTIPIRWSSDRILGNFYQRWCSSYTTHPLPNVCNSVLDFWRCVYRALYCNVLMTNEMHISYDQFLFHSFLSSLHVSNEASRSSSGAQHNIPYYIHSTIGTIVQTCLDSPARLYRLYQTV